MWKVFVAVLLCAVSTNLSQAQFFRGQSTRCRNPNQRTGTCVSIHDCQILISVLQRVPLQRTDVEFVKASECQNGYGSGPYVCCAGDTGFAQRQQPQPEQSQQSSRRQPSPARRSPGKRTILFPTDNNSFHSTPSQSNNFNDRRQFGRGDSPVNAVSTSSLLPSLPACGGVTIENKIYGGSDADLYEFPWMVLFEYNRKSGGRANSCAGSLINQRYVLTAAHCVKGAIENVIGKLVSIRLGEHDTTSQVDCNQFSCAPEAVRVGIDEIIPHELYKDASVNKEHDIALVRLDRNIRFSDSIRPICLPSAVSQGRSSPSSSQFTVAGWGRTLQAKSSPVKQKLKMALVDQEVCRNKFLTRKVNIVDSQLCAGGKFSEDSCEGDSGSPLMSFRGGAWVLDGVVSFGVKCGLLDWPAVHTRVSSYESWISRNIRA